MPGARQEDVNVGPDTAVNHVTWGCSLIGCCSSLFLYKNNPTRQKEDEGSWSNLIYRFSSKWWRRVLTPELLLLLFWETEVITGVGVLSHCFARLMLQSVGTEVQWTATWVRDLKYILSPAATAADVWTQTVPRQQSRNQKENQSLLEGFVNSSKPTVWGAGRIFTFSFLSEKQESAVDVFISFTHFI